MHAAALIVAQQGKKRSGQFIVGKKERGLGGEVLGSWRKAVRDLNLVKKNTGTGIIKNIEWWKRGLFSKMKRNRADRGGDDTQHMEDRKTRQHH